MHRRTVRAYSRVSLALSTVVFAILALGLTAPGASAATPVAAYSFDEGVGSTLHDSAGGNDGTVEGATWTSSGKHGGALDFDGTDDLVSIPDAPSLNFTTSFTLEAWVSPDTSTNWGATVIDKSDDANDTTGYWLSTQGIEESLGPEVPQGYAARWGTVKGVAGTGELPTNTWSHLALTSDGTNLRLYVDGELISTASGTSAEATASSLKLGRGNLWDTYFDGKIDEVRLYDIALSQSDIEADRDKGIGLHPTPIAAYTFDEGTGTTLHDSVGNHDGTISGATWSSSGRYGSALEFDSTTDLVTVADANDLDLTDELTLEAWVRPTAGGMVINKNLGYTGYSLGLTGGLKAEGLVAGRGDDLLWHLHFATSESALPTSSWSHLAFTSNGDTMRLYVDGVLVDTSPSVSAWENTEPLRIGGSFKGQIDEIRLYDHALHQGQIKVDRDTPVDLDGTRVAAYSFDENEGTMLHDSARSHDGAIEGATWTSSGKFGSALDFDGTNDLVKVADDADLDLTSSFTLAAWVKPDNLTYALRAAISKLKFEVGGPTSGYGLFSRYGPNSGGYICGSGECKSVESPTAISAGSWSHLATTFDGSNLRFYLNGDLVATKAAPAANGSSANLSIGHVPLGTSINLYFDGKIDEARIYDEALSEDVIEADRDRGIGIDIQPPDTQITEGPKQEEIVNGQNVTFDFTSTEAPNYFECSLDGGQFANCSAPKSYTKLSVGEHTFRVRAIDTAYNIDTTPVERTFEINLPPQTTITSPQPSYTSGDTPSIAFTSNEGASTFKCSLDGGAFSTCTSPYTPPSKPASGWHTFEVVATDEHAYADSTPAKYAFNLAAYPPAPSTSKLTSPEEGGWAASYYTLRSEWGSAPEGGGVSLVSYQLKLPAWNTFKAIPSGYLLDTEGNQAEWAISVAGYKPGTSPSLFFDVQAYAEAEGWAPTVEGVQLRALFNGGPKAAGASTPVTTTYSRFGAASATTAQAGPANVDLITGAFTITRTDVSIPVPGSEANLEFTRTYNSAYGANEKTNSKTLGEMWQPSAPVESEYASEAWQKLLVQHRNAVPPVYDEECWEEEGEKECEKWMVEEEIPAADWVEVLDNGGAGISFDKQGTSYVAPEEAKEFILTKPGSNFILADSNGTKTEFSQNGSTNEYQPSKVSYAGTSKESRLTYGISEGKKRLLSIIGPAPSGVTCNPLEGESSYAPKTAGCRSLYFGYINFDIEGAPDEQRLDKITYYDSSGSGTGQTVARYGYYSATGNLSEAWDPRISPEPLKERYAYESTEDARLTRLTPPGTEPWNFAYYAAGSGGAYEAKLKSVSRATLLKEGPETATTTIAYDVPASGESAPYDLGLSAIADWGQSDYPVDATAIFPPTEIPSDPPSDYSEAVVHYLDPDGNEVNTASPAPPGVTGDVITTAEVDRHGNVVRSLSPSNRLLALANEDPVARSKELDTHVTYNTDGTEMLESWGPLHMVQLQSGTTAQARLYTSVSYDKDAPTPPTGTPPPHLPTREVQKAWIPDEEIWADGSATETRYDWDLRRPIETIVDPGKEPEHLNIITKTVYNSAGQVKEERMPSDTEGKNAGTTKTVYWTSGTNSEQSACGNKAAWAGLPCVTHPVADPSPAESNPKLPWTWTTKYSSLDAPEELQEKTNGVLKRTTTIEYDSAGRVKKTKITGEGTVLPAVEATYNSSTGAPEIQKLKCETAEECWGSLDTQQLSATYDKLGRLTKYEDADGNKSEISYDAYGRPVYIHDGKGSQTTTYDEDSGMPTKLVDSAAGTFTATYNANGQMTEQVLPNGVAQQITYDVEGTAVGLKYQKVSGCESGCTWLKFNRQFSIGGQVLKETGTLATKEYTYDKAGRLTLATEKPTGEGCTTRAYAFEGTAGKNSNRTSRITRAPKVGGACDTTSEGTKTSYSYDTADRLIGSGVTYDSLGRITSLPSAYSGGGTLETTYYVNDLTRVQTQDGLTNTYYLDAALRQRERVQSGSKSGTEVYHYAGASDSPAWTQEGANWTRNVAAMGGSLGALQKSSGEITFQLADMHGDVVGIAESNPSATKLKSTQQFDEFGNPKQSNTPKFGWLGAKSRRTELPSGVIQMGLRSYVPAMGRFLTPDPIRGGSANAYDYANQDPVNNFDLTGECYSGRGAKRACREIARRRIEKKARRKARENGLRRLARARRGGGARASIMSIDLGFALGALQGDVADHVSDPVGDLARTTAGYAVSIVRNYAEAKYKSAKELAERAIDAMKAAGEWSYDHRAQIYDCLTGAFAAFVEARTMALAGPAGHAALGLYMAVNCGIAFV
jgi:RHS repeat-associated protein